MKDCYDATETENQSCQGIWQDLLQFRQLF